MIIKVKKINNIAIKPIKTHDTDACYDMTATWMKETPQYIEYGTDISFDIPKGYVGLIFSRSSITKEDLMLKNSVGVIDSGYQGEVKFRFTKIANDTWEKYKHSINICEPKRELQIYKIGERIGQIMFIKLPNIELCLVDDFNETKRGINGFGSSGK